MQHVTATNKNLVSGSLLCRDGIKVVLKSKKVVISKSGLFIGKGYECEGLFRFSLSDFCNKFLMIYAVVLMRVKLVFGIHVYIT